LPNDLINSDRADGISSSRLDGENHGYHRGPFGIRLTPMMRHQSGDQMAARSVSGFMDLYNITNSNTEFRQLWSSGASFGYRRQSSRRTSFASA